MDYFKCRICHRVLPLSEFHICKHRKNGHTSECKTCKNRIDRARNLEKRKLMTDDEKVARLFKQKKLRVNSEAFDILLKRVTDNLQSIPDKVWPQFLNQVLYKYSNESTPARVDCNSLLRDKQN